MERPLAVAGNRSELFWRNNLVGHVNKKASILEPQILALSKAEENMDKNIPLPS